MPIPPILAAPRSAYRQALIVVAVSLALLAAFLTVPPPRALAATPAPNGAFALHGGLGGAVDERTGQFSTSVPLTTIRGDGHAGISVSLSWQSARATATVDRSGWGAGWSLGTSFVDVTGLRRVYPASGGVFFLDPTEPSGLKHYKLRDLTFTVEAGILPRRPGAAQVNYSYELAYDDGRTDYFDVNGNLAARTDRHGNRTDLTWRPRANNVWQPTSIIDSYGLATTFDYSVANQVKVLSPTRSDGVQPVTTITTNASQGVQNVTDPAGHRTVFGYTSVSGAPKPILTSITAATGARSAISYQTPSYQTSLLVVNTLRLTDVAGNPLSPAQTFNVNPAGNNRHNFTGYPNHLGTGGNDALFASGDAAYTYTTSLSTGSTTTLSTYDALHRLVNRTISVTPAVGQLPVAAQAHQTTYPTEVTQPTRLPANFNKPKRVALTQSSATNSQGFKASTARTSTSATEYDDHGRLISATDESGRTTTTAYDDTYGLVTRQTTVGTDGAKAETINTLTADQRNIETSTTSVGTDGEELSARQILSYTYDDEGRVLTRKLAWAPGAEPDAAEPGGGPDEVVTKFDRSVAVDQVTQTLTTTTAHGTDAATETTVEVDLVSGQAVSHRDALGRETTLGYDAAGRRTRITTPGGLVTATAYTPTQTTTTGPDGKITRSTTDLLGRTVSVSDNVRGGVLVADPTARSLATTTYSADGTSVVATDQAGRESTTRLDAFGRTVSRTGPTGLTHLTSYDDGAAHTKVASLVPEGASQPQMSSATTYDDAGRAVQSRTTYPTDGTRPGGGFDSDPVSAAAFDGLGQPTTNTGNDLTVTTDRSGLGGMPASSTATPQATADFPGEPLQAVTTHSLTGAATSRTLSQGDQVSTAVAVTYDAAGNVVTATDPEGRITTYTYTDDGQPSTKTDPSGAVTTHTYDATSGLLSGISVAAPGKTTRTMTYTRVPAGKPGAGQVDTVTDGTGTITYGYDADGHRTSVSYPDGTATSAAYNDKGQLTSSTDVTGAVTTYVYDPDDGTMTSATQKRGTTVLATVTYGYDTMDRVATTTRGNGTVTTNTYTASNQLALQTTTNAGGTTLEAHSYTYDEHRNPATRTDAYPSGGGASVPGGSATWTTTYSYDAYDRLVGSAVYSGPLVDGAPTGLPATSTTYTIDLGGDVTATTRTRRIPGPRPITSRSTATNTIDKSGQLTSQQSGTTTRSQTFDDDGRVLKGLDGTTTTYGVDGSPASRRLADGTQTAYTFWPDGTKRSATTTAPDGSTSTISLHYGPDGTLVNDSTTDSSTGASTAATASYLLTAGREARTLLPGTGTSGKVTGTPAAPVTTGRGVGYYLRDRHTSVTGLLDSAGAVSATYAYTDYGAPARADGTPITATGADGGRANPFTYLGASPRGPWTEAGSGRIVFTDRSYDPGQGRFTSPDSVDAHNRYQGFNTNPIVYVDLSGRMSTLDIVLDVIFAVVFVATAILTAGAAAAAIGAAAAAVEAGISLTAGVVLNVGATVIGTAANLVGAVTSAWLASDGISQAIGKGPLMTDETRATVTLVQSIASATAGATGAIQGFTESAVVAIKAATATAKATAMTAADAQLGATLEQDFVAVTYDASVGDEASVASSDHVDVPAATESEAETVIENSSSSESESSVHEPDQLQPENDDLVEGDSASESGTDDDPDPVVENRGEPEVPQQQINQVNNPQVVETLPGSPRLTITDVSALTSNPAIPVSMEVTTVVDRVVEPPTVNDPQPPPTTDHITNETSVPAMPTDESGTNRSPNTFTNDNLIIVK